jgi:hypothetical protein
VVKRGEKYYTKESSVHKIFSQDLIYTHTQHRAELSSEKKAGERKHTRKTSTGLDGMKGREKIQNGGI